MAALEDHADAILALGKGESHTVGGYTWRIDDEELVELLDSKGNFVNAFLQDEFFIEMNWPFDDE